MDENLFGETLTIIIMYNGYSVYGSKPSYKITDDILSIIKEEKLKVEKEKDVKSFNLKIERRDKYCDTGDNGCNHRYQSIDEKNNQPSADIFITHKIKPFVFTVTDYKCLLCGYEVVATVSYYRPIALCGEICKSQPLTTLLYRESNG